MDLNVVFPLLPDGEIFLFIIRSSKRYNDCVENRDTCQYSNLITPLKYNGCYHKYLFIRIDPNE